MTHCVSWSSLPCLRSITPTVPLVMLEAVKLMAAVCLVPPDGHDKVSFTSPYT